MDKDELYSIGDVAKLLGISVPHLRYYDKIDLLRPTYTNPETGYRYYSYIQLSMLDRILYLESIGLSLLEIKTVFATGNVNTLLPYLQKELTEKEEALQKLQDNIDILKWYINFYQYPNWKEFLGVPYKRNLEERYVLAVSSLPEEQNLRDSACTSKASLMLHKLKSEKKFKDVAFLRQHGNIISFSSMLKGKWDAKNYFVYLKKSPPFIDEHIITFPAGEYLCFQGRPLIDQWDVSMIAKLFSHLPSTMHPTLVIANEYEENFTNFVSSLYEIQILFKPLAK